MTATEESVNTKKRKMHPNSLANLQMWKPGESGNAKGKDIKITPHLRRLAGMKVKDFYRLPIYDLTMAEAIAVGILMLSVQESGSKERQQVLDRLDGAVDRKEGTASVELNAGEGKRVKFTLNLGSANGDDDIGS